MKEVVQDTLVPDQFADFLSIRLSDGLQKQPGLLVDTCSVLIGSAYTHRRRKQGAPPPTSS